MADIASVDRRILVVAAAVFALLMAFSARYGFQGDELYFLDCARHLSLSYVDQPVFVPLVARLSLDLFGVSLTGLRLWPALAAAGTVITGGLLAREFGGGRLAQLTAALAVATSGALLASGHILNTTVFDLAAWTGLAFCVARIGRTGDLRWWVPTGAVLGVGLANKHSLGFFAVALVIGTLLSGGRRFLASRYCAAGALIAAACAVPDVWWQARHGWATIAMTRALAAENGGLGNAFVFIGSQVFMVAPVLIVVWAGGLRFLWRSERPLWRGLAWSYGLLFVFFAAATGAKPYYLAGTYFFLLPAGAVAWEATLATRRQQLAAALPLAICTLVTLPIVLPILPARVAGWTSIVNPVTTQTIGWPELVRTVTGTWDQLPPGQRANTVIFTADYEEAGAINELGRNLPRAVSGHNTVWWWGPGNPRASTVLAVLPAQPAAGVARLLAQLKGDFASVTVIAILGNPDHVPGTLADGTVYLCRHPIQAWGKLWPSFRHYG
jgi:4-amino-4-deoxy-L-arabinose transferase-like glycosyltransferase